MLKARAHVNNTCSTHAYTAKASAAALLARTLTAATPKLYNTHGSSTRINSIRGNNTHNNPYSLSKQQHTSEWLLAAHSARASNAAASTPMVFKPTTPAVKSSFYATSKSVCKSKGTVGVG